MPAGIGELSFFHDLQQHVVRFGMSFFDLIKDDDGVRAAADGFGELAGFFKADIARRRTYQPADVVAFHELGHVDLDQRVFTAKEEACQRLGEGGLAHAGGSEEHEGADRSARIFQARHVRGVQPWRWSGWLHPVRRCVLRSSSSMCSRR